MSRSALFLMAVVAATIIIPVETGWSAVRPPAPPTFVSASDGAYAIMVQVTWNSSSGATHYQVYRATSALGTKTPLGAWQSSTSFNDYPPTPETTYYYWVKAAMSSSGYNQSGYSAYDTGWRTVPPDPPTGVVASDGAYTDMVWVTWNSSSRATHYRLYRSDSATGPETALTGWQTARVYADSSATPGVTYYYWVKASLSNSGYDQGGYSTYDTGFRALSPPTGVLASDGTYTDKVRVTWDWSSSFSFYGLYRATSPTEFPTALAGWQTARTYDDTSATPGTTYYYSVRGLDTTSGEITSFSAYDTGFRALVPPAAPTGVSASDGTYTDKVRVTWNSSSGATHYHVYRSTSLTGSKWSQGSWQTGTT